MRGAQLGLLLVVFLISIAAPAADHYVSPTGSDSNDGSQAHPWQTINHADAVVVAGDTVHVADGTYRVTATGTGYYIGAITTTKSGTSGARIRYVSDNKWGAHIVSYGYAYTPSSDLSSGPNDTWYNTGNYVDIVGFDISGDGHIGILNDGSYVNEQSNHIHDILSTYSCNGFTGGAAGIDNADDVTGATGNNALANWIHDIGDQSNRCGSGGHGVYQAILGGNIENNLIYRVQGFCVHMWHHATGVTVLFNTVFQGYGGVVIGGSDGSTNDNTNVSNNILVNNQAYGIEEYGTVGDHNVYHNNIDSGNPDDLSLLDSHTAVRTLNAAASTLFVNWQIDGSGDYHLKAGSPAIDAADPSYPVSTDFDGVSRPQGGGYDIGAFEYVPPPSPPTVSTAVAH